ncbi:MAG: DUF3429 domain-containing protein [Gammaproteobacteria bacterium]|jgi:hypothetical protein|nr:DUF3429 domain-containing protein [Gammaproteobacteria bacterium]
MFKNQQQTPVAARWLGYAGVLPFAAGAINLHFSWPLFDGFALQVFIVYSAVVLSFLGGMRWGQASLQSTHPWPAYLLAILPSLIAVSAVLLPRPGWQLLALAAGFAGIGLLDVVRPAAGTPMWLQSLRWQLTGLVLLTHLLAWLAIRTW